MRKHKAEIGTVSNGTMRDEDLIPSFLNHLQWLDPKRITKLRKDTTWKRLTNYLKKGNDLDGYSDAGGFDGGCLSDLSVELFEILSEYAPPYCSFGSSEGDGAQYGFWPSPWHEIKQETDALIVSDTSEVPRGYRGEVFHVTDHGNLTLYTCNSRGNLKEIWGIV